MTRPHRVRVVTGVVTVGALLVAAAASSAQGRFLNTGDRRLVSLNTSFVEHRGSSLTLDGRTFRFGGANEYWLGLDDNLRDPSGAPTYPTAQRITDGLDSARALGVTVVRAHTLGISAGTPQSVEPALGVWNDDAFASIDRAVAEAGARGLRFIVPLTDQWRYYHGGKSVFTGWRGYPNAASTDDTAGSSEEQRRSEANFYTDPQVIADFEDYVAHLLTHRNPLTGLELRDDPTIMAWETGNELFDATPAWTETISRFIKSTAPRQLVSDGSACTGCRVGEHGGLSSPAVDIVGNHFYPRDIPRMREDAALAAAAGKAYVVGEYAWTGQARDGSNLTSFLAAAAIDDDVTGAAFWTLLPHDEDGVPEPHDDGYQLWFPGVDPGMVLALARLKAFGVSMTAQSVLLPLPAPPSPSPPGTPSASPTAPAAGTPTTVPTATATTGPTTPAPTGPAPTSPSTPPAPVTAPAPLPSPSSRPTTPRPSSHPTPAPPTVSVPALPLPVAPVPAPTLTPVPPLPLPTAASPSFGPLDADAWQAWTDAGAAAGSHGDDVRLRTGTTSSSDPAAGSVTLAPRGARGEPRRDLRAQVTLTPGTASGTVALIVRAASSGQSTGHDDGLAVVIDAAAGTVQVLRNGNFAAALSSPLALPGWRPGTPATVTVSADDDHVAVTASTPQGSVSWSGVERTVTGSGTVAIVARGDAGAADVVVSDLRIA